MRITFRMKNAISFILAFLSNLKKAWKIKMKASDDFDSIYSDFF